MKKIILFSLLALCLIGTNILKAEEEVVDVSTTLEEAKDYCGTYDSYNYAQCVANSNYAKNYFDSYLENLGVDFSLYNNKTTLIGFMYSTASGLNLDNNYKGQKLNMIYTVSEDEWDDYAYEPIGLTQIVLNEKEYNAELGSVAQANGYNTFHDYFGVNHIHLTEHKLYLLVKTLYIEDLPDEFVFNSFTIGENNYTENVDYRKVSYEPAIKFKFEKKENSVSTIINKTILIEDKVVVSKLDQLFITYNHYVLFNTDIPFDKIYSINIGFTTKGNLLYKSKDLRIDVYSIDHITYLFGSDDYAIHEYNKEYKDKTYKWEIDLNVAYCSKYNAFNLDFIKERARINTASKIKDTVIFSISFYDPEGNYVELPAVDNLQDSINDNTYIGYNEVDSSTGLFAQILNILSIVCFVIILYYIIKVFKLLFK